MGANEGIVALVAKKRRHWSDRFRMTTTHAYGVDISP